MVACHFMSHVCVHACAHLRTVEAEGEAKGKPGGSHAMLGEAGPQTFPYHWGEAVETTNPFSHSKKGHFRTVLSYKNKREAEREAMGKPGGSHAKKREAGPSTCVFLRVLAGSRRGN